MALSDASTDLLLILDDLTHRRLVLLKSCSSASCSAVAAHFSCGTYDHPASKYTLPQMARLLDILQPGESLMTLHLSHCVLTSSLPVYSKVGQLGTASHRQGRPMGFGGLLMLNCCPWR